MARFATFLVRARDPRFAGSNRGGSWWGALWLLGLMALAACGPRVAAPPPTAQAPQPGPMAPAPVPAKTKVALLLPLTGPSASLGQPMLEAAQLALFDLAGDRFELLPRDTKGTPQAAADAARAALAEGASLILGPVFSPEVAAVKPVAQAAGVDVLAFTTDWTLAGGGTHIMGFVPGDQVNRVMGFARSRGMTRFGAVAPRSAYGDAVLNAMQAAAQRYGGQLVQVERTEPAMNDFSAAARAIAQTPAQPQGVLLAEGGERVKALAASLVGGGVNPAQVRFLGTGLWDEPGLGQQPALVGAWFAAPSPEARTDFEARFEALYGKRPPRLATLAYDAVALAAVLTRTGGPNPFNRVALTNPNGFAGIDGLFRLRPTGLVDRGLAVMEVTPTGAMVIDPAPASFEMLGQ